MTGWTEQAQTTRPCRSSVQFAIRSTASSRVPETRTTTSSGAWMGSSTSNSSSAAVDRRSPQSSTSAYGVHLWTYDDGSKLFANLMDTTGTDHWVMSAPVFQTNTWYHVALTYDGNVGVWTVTLPLSAGRHLYAFVVDGSWIPDPRAPLAPDGGFGHANSVKIVGGSRA